MNNKAIDKLQKQYEAKQAEAERLRGAIKELTKKSNALAAEMEEAASAGDLARFRDLKAQRSEVDEEIYVAQQQRKKPETVPEAAAASAWKEFRSDYEKDFERLQKALRKAGDELEHLFVDLVRLQADALRERERLAVYAGTDPEQIESTYSMSYITKNERRQPGMVPYSTPEVIYFVTSDRWTQDAAKQYRCAEADAAWEVIGHHKAASL